MTRQTVTRTGYTLDVDYQSLLGAHQTPLHMSIAAGLAGYCAPRLLGRFTYLDVGCGDGTIACSIAAAYPLADVIGIDVSASHITKAQALAKTTNLENVRFLEGDLTDWRSIELPEYDFAAVAGLYAWLDQARRGALRALLAARARPGALTYVDYAAAPGCASIEPLYRLLRRLTSASAGGSVEALNAAADTVKSLAAGGARFFAEHPNARTRLDRLFEGGNGIEAHEILNLTEPVPWFEDVANDFSEVGLEWIASAFLTTNFPHLVLPPPLARVVAAAEPRLAETLKDVCLSTGRRADVFAAPGSSVIGARAALAERPVIGPPQREVWRRAAERSDVLRSPGVESLFDAPPPTLGAAFERIGGADGDQSAILELLALGVLTVGAAPLRQLCGSDAVKLSSFNRHMLELGLDRLDPPPLVSPVAGSRLLLPLLDRIALFACTGGDLHSVYERLREAGLDVDRAFGPGPTRFAAGAAELAAAFRAGPLQRLERLGVVEAA